LNVPSHSTYRASVEAEDGTYAVIFAAVILAMLAFSAVAVDLSGFFEDARHQQTFADLACLAGVRELPEDPEEALDRAAENIGQHLDVEGTSEPENGQPWEVGRYTVTIEAPHDESTTMRVTVAQESPTFFGRVFGIDSVDVSQVATCGVFALGGLDLPFGVLTSTPFGGILQQENPCGEDMGNCQQLIIPRSDGKGPPFLPWNISLGADRTLTTYGENPTPCYEPGLESGAECGLLRTDTGGTIGQLSDGMVREHQGQPGRLRLFEDPAPPLGEYDALHLPNKGRGRMINNDPFEGVFEWDPPDPIPPDDPGPIVVSHIKDCSHPRIGRIPIVRIHDPGPAEDPDGWPAGSKDMEITGFHFVYIMKPNDEDHFTNSDAIREVTARAIDPDGVLCSSNGQAVPFTEGDVKMIRLLPNA
jgi:hypothetical protein